MVGWLIVDLNPCDFLALELCLRNLVYFGLQFFFLQLLCCSRTLETNCPGYFSFAIVIAIGIAVAVEDMTKRLQLGLDSCPKL